MSNIWSAMIGRSVNCDLQLLDESVSRLHVELTRSRSGRLYVVDCGSSHGTFVHRGGRWEPVRQDYVEGEERLRLGDFEIRARELLEAARSAMDRASRARSPEPEGGDGAHAEEPEPMPKGRVARNPITGEIEARD